MVDTYLTYSKNFVKHFITDKHLIVVTIIAIIMSLFYGYLLIWKHGVFYTNAWDLGIYAQALKSTLEGRFMYHTPQLFVVPSGNHMEIHFTPLLLLLLPLYFLVPRAETLLIIKSFASFMAIIPLYLISKKVFKNSTIALTIPLLYLLYPPLHGALWFDFQPQAFLPLFVFSAEYAYLLNKKWLWILFLSLTAMTIEHGALITIVTLVLKLVGKLKDLKHRERETSSSLRTFVYILLTLIAFLAYFVTITSYLENRQNNNTITEFRDFLRAYDNWKVLGFKGNTFLLPLYVVMHPDKALDALLYDYHIKFLNVMITYGTLFFIPLFNVYGIISLAMQIPFLLSNYRAYYTVGSHYPYYYIPFVFLGLIYALVNELNRNHAKLNVKGLILAMIIALISTAPYSPLAMQFVKEAGMLWYPTIDTRGVESLHKLVKLSNELDKSILVQNHVFPHTTLKQHVYVAPLMSVFNFNSTAANKYLNEILGKVELVLLDTSQPFFDDVSEEVLKKALEGGFGVYAASRRGVLLMRNYSGEILELDDLDHLIFSYSDMIKGKRAEKVEGAYRLSKGIEEYVVYGPYTFLLPGVYEACYKLIIHEVVDGPIVLLDVATDRGRRILASRIVSGVEVNFIGVEVEIRVNFAISRPVMHVEFRVYSFGKSDVYFRLVEVRRLSPRSNITIGDIAITVDKLYLSKEAFITDEMLVANLTTSLNYLWWGPYISLPKGRYIVSLYLGIEPQPQNSVMVIDIVYARGMIKLVEVEVTKTSIKHLRGKWYLLEVPINLFSDINDLEVRCVKALQGYSISLSHIQIIGDLQDAINRY